MFFLGLFGHPDTMDILSGPIFFYLIQNIDQHGPVVQSAPLMQDRWLIEPYLNHFSFFMIIYIYVDKKVQCVK